MSINIWLLKFVKKLKIINGKNENIIESESACGFLYLLPKKTKLNKIKNIKRMEKTTSMFSIQFTIRALRFHEYISLYYEYMNFHDV